MDERGAAEDRRAALESAGESLWPPSSAIASNAVACVSSHTSSRSSSSKCAVAVVGDPCSDPSGAACGATPREASFAGRSGCFEHATNVTSSITSSPTPPSPLASALDRKRRENMSIWLSDANNGAFGTGGCRKSSLQLQHQRNGQRLYLVATQWQRDDGQLAAKMDLEHTLALV